MGRASYPGFRLGGFSILVVDGESSLSVHRVERAPNVGGGWRGLPISSSDG
jgi:hypothetical protein